MAITRHITHIKSKVVESSNPKLPASGDIEFGEIAVNYAKGYETISIKNESGTVVTFSEDKNIGKKGKLTGYAKASSASAVATGDTINTAIGKLEKALDGKQASGSYLTGTTKYAGSSSQGGAATSANKINTDAGNTTTPVYFSGGVPVALSYTISKSVPSNAVFTDTATTLSGHFAPSATSANTKTASASSTSELDWGSAVVTGVTLSGDAKGHITAVAVSSGKLKTPVTGVTLASGTNNGTVKLTVNGSATDNIAVKGLGTAAYKAEGYFAGSGHTHTNMVTGSGLTANDIMLGDGSSAIKASGKSIETTLSSTLDTKVPTSKAVATYVSQQMASALTYKGSISSNNTLKNTHKVGDVYVVSSAGTYAGKACEVGDYLIANTARASASTVTNADWDAINGENQVENKSASLAAAGSSATIATVDGTNITITTPSTWTGVDKAGTLTGVTLTSGTNNGTVKLTVNGSTTDNIAVKGLDSMAYQATSSYSSATQVNTALSGKSGTGHTHNYAGSSTAGGAATSAAKLTNTTAIGSVTQPVFFTASGVPSACTYTLGKSVPSDAVFTDNNTTYAAGSFVTITGTNNAINVSTGTSSSTVARGDHNHSGVYQPVGNYLTSHQTVTLASGTNNGTLKITTAAGTTDNIAVKGLNSMAYQATSSYSSATQVNTALANKLDKTEYATFSAATNASIEDLSGQNETVSEALNDLNVRKLNKDTINISSLVIYSNTSSVCSITGSSNTGKIQTIIYKNSSTSTDRTVTVPTTYQTPDGAAIELTCPKNGYCEVSYLNIDGTIYARGL